MVSVEVPSLTHSLLGAAALYLCYCIYWELTTGARRRRMIAEHGCLPPVKLPDWDPFFGMGTFRATSKALKERRALRLTQERFAKMGSTTFGVNFGLLRFYMTTEPENLKVMQATDFKNWSLGDRRKTAFVPFLGHGIFTTDGSQWQHSREMLRPNFHRSQVSDLPVFEEHIQDLLSNIPRDGKTVVDLQDLFFRLTIDSATEFLFGQSTKSLAPGTTQRSAAKFADAFNAAQEGVGNRSRFGYLSFLLQPGYHQHIKYVHEFTDDFVEAAIARKGQTDEKHRYVFADELVQRIDDKVRIRSELLNILLAGRDTTASLLSNVFHTLARRPDILAKLRGEIDETLNGEIPDWQQLKEMKYLKAVLNESLRMYPVVPGNSRQAMSDTVLPKGGGPDGQSPMFVPKGQNIGWSVYTMHRRKDFYGPDADEFKPERWLGEKGLRPGWEYLPFNGGARICLGQQFALTEASYTIVRLLQHFKGVETTDPEPWTEWLTLTCTNAYGLPVRLTPV